MISWASTLILAIVITGIVWIEVRYGRKAKSTLASTNEQIESIKRNATERYRAKFGRDPTGTFETPKIAEKKS